MKIIKYLFICSLITVMAVSCEKGLDPINAVEPGPDMLPPEVVINYPTEGQVVRAADEIATVIFRAVASDDIELQSVNLELDGASIGSITSFIDYRRIDVAFEYTNLTAGDHILTVSTMDLAGKNASQTVNFVKITVPVYTPLDGEVLYFPFDGNFYDAISGNEAIIVGSPGFGMGKVGDAYQGATDSYLQYPADGLLGDEFSVAFWYKVNADPTRGGVVVISPPGEDRITGLRMFREGDASLQKLGLNFGIGTPIEIWINPFLNFPPDQDWMHVALSITSAQAAIYIDGELISETPIDGKIDWTGCTDITIASGQPNFVYWEHFSDLSLYDEMHIFKRAITAAEVQKLFSGK